MWLQEFLETILVLQPQCKLSPKLQITFEFGASWIFKSLITRAPLRTLHSSLRCYVRYVGTKGVLQLYHLCFDENKVLKLSIGYAKSLFKCTGPLSKIYSQEVLTEWILEQRNLNWSLKSIWMKAFLENQKHSASEESAPEDDVIRS